MKILVIVPTFNRSNYLQQAIDSIIAQTRKPDDVLVVGNVKPWHCPYRFIYTDEFLIHKLNRAIDNSDCDAFIILCDDDTILPQYIEKTAAVMEKENADVVYTEDNNEPVTSLVRKSIWTTVGGFKMVGFFDWDFYQSCREAGGKAVPIREHLFEYRNHREQRDNHHKLKTDGTWARWEEEMYTRHPSLRP